MGIQHNLAYKIRGRFIELMVSRALGEIDLLQAYSINLNASKWYEI